MSKIDTNKAYDDVITAKRWLMHCGYWPVHTAPGEPQLWGKVSHETFYMVGKSSVREKWYIVEKDADTAPPTDIVVPNENQKDLFGF